MSDDLWSWTASDLATGIAAGAISSEEATLSALARMEAVNPALNAVVDPLPEAALEAARAADAARAAGAPLGPLHGVPVTVKVNVDYAGRATTNGVVALKDHIAPADGSVVRNLRAAGAVILGRTNTPAFSYRWFTENDLHGETRNPWNAGVTPGGSSGGASSATAAGVGAMGHGNDIGGSVRYPAYCCGLFGLRPTSGVIPAFNPSQTAERPIVSQMSSVQGPLARSVADIRLSMTAMAPRDPRDVWWTPSPAFDPVAVHRPCRVAVLAEAEAGPTDPVVSAAIRRAAGWLADAGYEVEEVAPPSLEEAAQLWVQILGNEILGGFYDTLVTHGDDRVRHSAGYLMRKVTELGRAEFLAAFGRRSTLLRQWLTFFEDWPLVLTASGWQRPYPLGHDQKPDADLPTLFSELSPMIAPPILGLPGLAVPTGEEGGLPTGVQLLAGRFQENLMLSAGAVIEARAPAVRPIDPR
ncbi:amidase [Paroceanicella profunda]|uniref:Amidase n=1 Tax=Paroceanicella profunda TaxID=2579971 RepID=A0A5B8FGT2_9RHOB|nr:amidase [Paroceanicella profunda]QDL91248.1 amidase [Paroceanicella profunda]